MYDIYLHVDNSWLHGHAANVAAHGNTEISSFSPVSSPTVLGDPIFAILISDKYSHMVAEPLVITSISIHIEDSTSVLEKGPRIIEN